MMEKREEWTPWVTWIQGPQPVPDNFLVQAEMGFVGSGDIIGPMPAADYSWNFPLDPIARYRVRIPPALTALREIVENLPERADA